MSDKYDVVAVRAYTVNGEEKTAFSRCGVFMPSKGGAPFEGTILFDSFPVSGKAIIKLAKPRTSEPNF